MSSNKLNNINPRKGYEQRWVRPDRTELLTKEGWQARNSQSISDHLLKRAEANEDGTIKMRGLVLMERKLAPPPDLVTKIETPKKSKTPKKGEDTSKAEAPSAGNDESKIIEV